MNNTNYPRILTDKILEYSKEKDEKLFDYQKIISQYMMREEVRGLLLYWGVGLGKTLMAVSIAEMFRKISNMKIIILSPKSLRDNFETTLEKNIKNYDSVKKNYTFATTGSPNMIRDILKSSIQNDNNEFSHNKLLYNKFIIVDEAHNLFNSITNGSKVASEFYDLIMRSRNIKLLFLTGTPIVNNFFEIVPALNMCKGYLKNPFNPEKNITLLPESYDSFVNMFLENSKVKNAEKLKNRIYGLISYYGPFYFSEHIPFQKQIQESIIKKDFPTLLPIKFIKVKMNPDQNSVYINARIKERLEGTKKIFGRGKNFLNSEGFDILTCPNDEYINNTDDLNYIKFNGGSIDKNKGNTISSYRIKSRQLSNIYLTQDGDEFLLNPSSFESISKANPISPKFKAVIENALKHKGQCGIIYSNFLKYGLVSISKYLDETEFKGKYALFTGDISIEERNDLVKRYNNSNNSHGEHIELLLISSTGEKGLNLKRVRHIHIMEPNWSYTTTEQIIGRGVRYKSHVDLPEEEQNVQVYQYMSDYSDGYTGTEKTTDLDIFYKSVRNKEVNDEFLKILASVSVECPKFNKYINFECFMCDYDNKILYIPNINDDMKIKNPCKTVILNEVIVDNKTLFYDSDIRLYEKNSYGFFVPNHDDIDDQIKNKIISLTKQ